MADRLPLSKYLLVSKYDLDVRRTASVVLDVHSADATLLAVTRRVVQCRYWVLLHFGRQFQRHYECVCRRTLSRTGRALPMRTGQRHEYTQARSDAAVRRNLAMEH